jgi:hypothetical protein
MTDSGFIYQAKPNAKHSTQATIRQCDTLSTHKAKGPGEFLPALLLCVTCCYLTGVDVAAAHDFRFHILLHSILLHVKVRAAHQTLWIFHPRCDLVPAVTGTVTELSILITVAVLGRGHVREGYVLIISR